MHTALLSTVGCQCNCLGSLAVGILYVHIVKFAICSSILYRSGSLIAGCPAQETGTVHNIDHIARVRRRIRCVAVDCEGSSSCRNNYLFRVGPSQDEKTLRRCGSRAQRIDSSLNLSSLDSAINKGAKRSYS
jgi:hypothetical protein